MPQMSADQIRSLVSENLDSLGVKIGLNNHEGSLITADTYAMKAVMEVCKSRGMFFLDSRTNSQSVCKSVASEYGVKLYERNIFLDFSYIDNPPISYKQKSEGKCAQGSVAKLCSERSLRPRDR